MKRKTSILAIILACAWCGAMCLVLYLVPRLCTPLNLKLYDWKVSVSPAPRHTDEIVHVDVDDAALSKFGQWPWDRSMSAKIVERLAELGARAVVFDVLYSSAGRSEEGNTAFFEAISAAGNVVSATALQVSADKKAAVDKDDENPRAEALYDRAWAVRIPNAYRLLKVTSVKSKFLPLPEIITRSAGIGHIKGTADPDGSHRRLALLVTLYERCIPSLTLATLGVCWGLTPQDIVLDPNGYLDIKRGSQTYRIPVDSRGMMPVHWGDIWESFNHYSVRDVLADTPDPNREARYKGKIVVVAVTATGTTDFGVTPVSGSSPLSRIHSHALSTIMTRNFIVEIPAMPWVVVIAVLVTLAFFAASSMMRWKFASTAGIGVCLAALGVVVLCFVKWSYEIPIGEFLLIFVPPSFAWLLVRAVSIERQAARTAKAMERYLAREVLERVLESGEELDISAKRRELTIVFVDIQGFSTISETVGVEYIHQFLNDFFQGMTKAIFDHHGTVDKFLGDGLLAFFGDPIPLENHAEAAVHAAMDMQREMHQLNRTWSQSGIRELSAGIRIRIGINTGMVIVGDLGSSRRLEYTVVGSAVNVASRLQAIAPPGGIMMTALTRAMLRNNVDCQGPDFVRVKGIDRDIEVFRIYPESIFGAAQSPPETGS